MTIILYIMISVIGICATIFLLWAVINVKKCRMCGSLFISHERIFKHILNRNICIDCHSTSGPIGRIFIKGTM